MRSSVMARRLRARHNVVRYSAEVAFSTRLLEPALRGSLRPPYDAAVTIEARTACRSCGDEWPATQNFCGRCGARLGAPTPELRTLTILFADLVGSTALSTRVDPEDLLTAMSRFHSLSEGVIERHGGSVLRFVGDGVLACFGVPALDDAPTRAVLAAQALVEASPMIDALPDDRLESRAGVHTGPVVLGTTGMGRSYASLDVIGEAANVAARLQGLAEPGQVVVSASTIDLVDSVSFVDYFDAEVRGLEHPLRVALVGQVPTEGIQVTGRERPKSAMIARGHELSTLLALLDLALTGEPQFVTVIGEPGIGKTRLVSEVRDRLIAPSVEVTEMRGLQDQASTPFAPLLDLLERTGPPSWISDDVRHRFAVVGVGASGGDTTPERARRDLIDAVCERVLASAGGKLAVLVLDDLQWFDPSTLELLSVLARRADGERLLVLATARPEWSDPWPEDSNSTMMALNRLGRDDVHEFLAGAKIDDDDLVTQVMQRSEGVPLFIEEFVRQHQSGGLNLNTTVPGSVSDLLRARLERLGPQLEIARRCSVLGREVDPAVMAEIEEVSTDVVVQRLEPLVDAGVLGRSQDGDRYSFTHVLLRDEAYSSLLRSHRVSLHSAAASAIEALTEQRGLEPYAEQLARHLTLADEPERAYRAWRQAGRLASARVALTEALAHYEEAMRSLMTLPSSPKRDHREVSLIFEKGPLAIRRLGGGHADIAAMYARAEELSATEPDPRKQAIMLSGIYSMWLSQANYIDAIAGLPRLLELGELVPEMAAANAFFAGSSLHLGGRLTEARMHLERALELTRTTTGSPPMLPVWTNGSLGEIAAQTDMTEARSYFADAGSVLEHSEHDAFERAWLEQAIAKSAALRGDVETARRHTMAAADLGSQFDLAQITGHTDNLIAWLDAIERPEDDEPIERFRGALAAMETCGSRADSSAHHLLLVRTLRLRGRIEEAAAELQLLDRYVEATGERVHERDIERERTELGASG